jgi:hypothetical protein
VLAEFVGTGLLVAAVIAAQRLSPRTSGSSCSRTSVATGAALVTISGYCP